MRISLEFDIIPILLHLCWFKFVTACPYTACCPWHMLTLTSILCLVRYSAGPGTQSVASISGHLHYCQIFEAEIDKAHLGLGPHQFLSPSCSSIRHTACFIDDIIYFYRILLLSQSYQNVLKAVSLLFLINSMPNFDGAQLAPPTTIPSVYSHHSALKESLPAIFLTCDIQSPLHIR